MKFIGTDGWLSVGYTGIRCEPAGIKDSVITDREIRLPASENHYRNFIECVKSRQDPVEPVETGHRTATLCHLGNLAMVLKRTLKWDPKREVILGDAEAAKLTERPLRVPWSCDMPLKA